ncbi:MAG: hypothetical protein Ta2D_01430 [Rickettsiales bacterium]|nr:MAG: hypothetical protein Ta2D_01430 [Rickettsiales bacterium]
MKYIFCFLLFVLCGCFPLTTRGISRVDIGDNKEQVIKKVGSPFYKMEYYTKQHLVYYFYDDFFSLFFADKFPYIGFYPLLRTGTEYWIILDNNKVISHGRAKAYQGSGSITRDLNMKIDNER